MRQDAGSTWIRGTLIGVAALAAITAIKLAFVDTIGHPTPFLLYFAAVLVAAWYGGLVAGLVTTGLAAALGHAAFIAAASDATWGTSAIRLGVFCAEGVAIAWIVARLGAEGRRAVAAVAEAHDSAGKLEAVLSGLDHGVTMQDASGRIVYANPAAAHLIGVDAPADVVGADPAALTARFVIKDEHGEPLSPEQLPGGAIRLGRSPEEILVQLETRGRPDVRWSRVGASAVRDENGELEFVVNVFRDVTDPRRVAQRAEFLARASEELGSSLDYATTLATVARLAVPTIADWCAVDIVEAGEVCRLAVTHVDPEKVKWVLALQERYPPDPEAPQGVPQILRSGEPEMIEVIPAELIEAGAQDEEHLRLIRQLELRSYIGVPLCRGDETFGAITLVMAESRRTYEKADLAFAMALADRASIAVENARLYRAAEAARVEAERANRTKDDFLAMLGHELRNPLAPILTALELMKLRGDGSVAREREIVERQVRSVVRLVDDLLDVLRITRGRVELDKARVELTDIVAKAFDVAQPLIETRRHTIEMRVPRGLVVEADAVRLGQVVGNLLTNAAKYTEPGGRITVVGERAGGHVRLCVRDTGIGIAPAMLASIFDVFVQAPQALDRAQGGLGLGLTIVRSLVQLHGGTVSACSDGPGKGSEFVVTLPAAAVEPAHAAEDGTAEPEPEAETTGVSILVVDDNTDALELMAEALTILGHRVYSAPDGSTALEIAAAKRPTIALLDLGLPEFDGCELARRLRALAGLEAIKLVAITGYGQASDRERTRAAGFSAHLVKPVRLETVRRVIDELCT